MPDMEVKMIYRKDRYLRGGDHSPFLAAGYPAIRFSEPTEIFKWQHQDVRVEDGIQYGDLPEYVDYDYTAKVTKINAANLASLALAPALPQNVGMIASRLENDTRLKWSPNTEPDLAGYMVVWRESSAPFWQYSQSVGLDTTTTIEKFSKDNYLFGVMAVDKDGHFSPAVYPAPTR